MVNRRIPRHIIKGRALSKEEYEEHSEEHKRRWFDPEIDEIAQDTPGMNTPMNL